MEISVAVLVQPHVSGATMPGGHQEVLPVDAIGLVAISVMVFLVALWGLGAATTRRNNRSPVFIVPSVAVAAGSVALVAIGLPLSIGLLILGCSPFLLISTITYLRSKRPEDFAVR